MARALNIGMRAEKLEDLLVYVKALEGIDAVSPLLERPRVIKDFDLHKQLSESTGKIPGHIGEGFGQGTDRRALSEICVGHNMRSLYAPQTETGKPAAEVLAPIPAEILDRSSATVR